LFCIQNQFFFPLVGHGWRQRLNLEVVQPISIHQGPNSI
jgi:hypothetical protein